MLTLESVESDHEIQFLQRALEENKRRTEERDVLHSYNATVTTDNELISSVESESDVGSSHKATPTYLSGSRNIVLNVPVEAPVLDLNKSDEVPVVRDLNVLV